MAKFFWSRPDLLNYLMFSPWSPSKSFDVSRHFLSHLTLKHLILMASLAAPEDLPDSFIVLPDTCWCGAHMAYRCLLLLHAEFSLSWGKWDMMTLIFTFLFTISSPTHVLFGLFRLLCLPCVFKAPSPHHLCWAPHSCLIPLEHSFSLQFCLFIIFSSVKYSILPLPLFGTKLCLKSYRNLIWRL